MDERIALFLEVLPKAVLGWLGIFIVTIIIILVLWLLDKLTQKKD